MLKLSALRQVFSLKHALEKRRMFEYACMERQEI